MSGSPEILDTLRSLVGAAHVLTEPASQQRYLSDWFGRQTGTALAVVRPGSTSEVAAIVRCCAQHGVPVVPQGGNTGLVGGALPDRSGRQLVLVLDRMRAIRDLDDVGKTITVEAGLELAHVHAAALSKGLEFPLSMGSEGSCTVGGMLSTNAGGTAVLRYGNARDLCLGLEVVTAQGRVWNGLGRLRKDNTGYDLRDLFIGAEGSLGVITAAVLKLMPLPRTRVSAMTLMGSPAEAVIFLKHAQDHLGSMLTAFELMSARCLQLVAQYFPQIQQPFELRSESYAVLLELVDFESEQHAINMLEGLLEKALSTGLVQDAVIPQSLAQSDRFWELREHIPLAQVEDGQNIKHDVSLPISQIDRFMSEAEEAVARCCPGARVIAFGHLGDGNLHFNVAAPAGHDPRDFMGRKDEVQRIVHDLVHALGGSMSAEHGIGSMKTAELLRYKDPEAVALMRTIKTALDPMGIMNPGKVLPSDSGLTG
jgi:FAD/FMN-containing dehydrogenase